uniref:Uncharacterized protein n=1 Tax=Physcomitrium patens TaxID=3218 RepID=A0A7I3Z0M5_PHYPA
MKRLLPLQLQSPNRAQQCEVFQPARIIHISQTKLLHDQLLRKNESRSYFVFKALQLTVMLILTFGGQDQVLLLISSPSHRQSLIVSSILVTFS